MNQQFQVQIKLIIHRVSKEKIKKLIILHLLDDYSLSLLIFLITDSTINSNIFCHFMMRLEYSIFKNNIFEYKKAL